MVPDGRAKLRNQIREIMERDGLAHAHGVAKVIIHKTILGSLRRKQVYFLRRSEDLGFQISVRLIIRIMDVMAEEIDAEMRALLETHDERRVRYEEEDEEQGWPTGSESGDDQDARDNGLLVDSADEHGSTDAQGGDGQDDGPVFDWAAEDGGFNQFAQAMV